MNKQNESQEETGSVIMSHEGMKGNEGSSLFSHPKSVTVDERLSS